MGWMDVLLPLFLLSADASISGDHQFLTHTHYSSIFIIYVIAIVLLQLTLLTFSEQPNNNSKNSSRDALRRAPPFRACLNCRSQQERLGNSCFNKSALGLDGHKYELAHPKAPEFGVMPILEALVSPHQGFRM